MLEKSDNMKRILSRAFFVIVLTLLVQIPFNVSKAEDVRNDSSVNTADTVRNTAVASDAVVLVVPETPVNLFFMFYKVSDSQGYRYQWYLNYTKDTVAVGDSSQITLKDFDWTIASEYIIVIETKNGVYKKVIKQTDMSKVLVLSLDTSVSIVLPPDLQTTDKSVGLNFLDDNGVFIMGLSLTNSVTTKIESGFFKIPYGRYDVQVSGNGGTLPYVLYKRNCVLSASNNKIVFASADTKKISLNLLQNNASKKTVRIKGIGIAYDSVRTSFVYPSLTSGMPCIMVSKALCDITALAEVIEDPYWEYQIEQTGVNTENLNTALDFSLKMQTEMALPESIKAGRELTGFYVRNDLKQTITIKQDTKVFSGIVEFTGASGASYTDTVSSNSVETKMSTVSEMFSVIYMVPGPLTVTPSVGSVFIYFPFESGIISIEPAKPSPQPVGSTIRWNCKTFGDDNNNQYYFKVFNGSTLVAASAAYSPAKYFEWTPKEPGTKYRAVVYMKNAQTLDGRKTVSKTSAYYTINAPVSITSVTPDPPAPQAVGVKIRWTCKITGGGDPVYYFKVYDGSTLLKSSSAYTSDNYFDWIPTSAGDKYRVYAYVKENGAASSTAKTKWSAYYTVKAAAPISITSLLPDKAGPQPVGSTVRWTCNITGGADPVYYFKVYNGNTLVKSSSAYTSDNYFDWNPTSAGSNYRVYVYVKESGAASSTAKTKWSAYYTVTAAAPITITSMTPNPASPQEIGMSIRWTCEVSGGISPVYYFKLFDGSSMIAHSADYTDDNYIDWTPLEEGSNYRVIVYVKEKGSSSYITKTSGYYTITGPALKVVNNGVVAVDANKIEVTFGEDIGSCSPSVFVVRSGSARDSAAVSGIDLVSSHDRTATLRLRSPIETDSSGLWLVPDHLELAKGIFGVAMSADAPSMQIIDKAAPVVSSAGTVSPTAIEVKFSENVSVPDINTLLSDLSIKKASDGSAVSISAEDITISDKRIVIEGLESGVEYKLSFLTGTSVVDNSPAHNTLIPYQSTITTSGAEIRFLEVPADTVIRFPMLHK